MQLDQLNTLISKTHYRSQVDLCTSCIQECNLHLAEQRSQLLLGWADRTAYIRRPASDFGWRKDSVFPQWMQYHTRYADTAKSNAKINTRTRCDNSAHVRNGCRH